jgi:hypothetical protein
MFEFFRFDADNKIQINIKKVFQYDVRDNSIGIKDLNSNKCSDIIPSLHEAGHYIINNKSKLAFEIFKISQYIIACNRLIILPIYSISILILSLFNYETIFITNIILKNTIFSYFCIASILRLFIGLTNEIFASWNALVFIKAEFSKEIFKLSKKFYIFAFIQQLFCFIIFTSVGLFIYFLV